MPTTPSATEFDLLVIGSGSGGATVALEAAALGVSCAIFEHRQAGGTCVHRGCVPKKLFWHAADIVRHADSAPYYGVDLEKDSLRVNYPVLRRHSRQHTDGIGRWFKAEFERAGVRLIPHRASFEDPHTVSADGIRYRGKRIVIATGSRPNRPDLPGADLLISSEEFFALEELPQRIAIVGSGYIAIELACALKACGVEVCVVVRRDNLSSHFDAEMSRELARLMVDQGIDILWQRRTERIDRCADQGLQISFAGDHAPHRCDCALWATGRSANTDGLNLDRLPLPLDENGYIATDTDQGTCFEHIYALGDVSGRRLLTPVAIRAARYLVRRLYKQEDVHFDYDNIASVIYAHPPLASIGLNEETAVARHGDDLRIWRSRFSTLGAALDPDSAPNALVKLIEQKSSGRIAGLHILAPNADEMMQGFAVAIAMGATKADFDRCVAIHPTVAEEVVTLK